MTAEPSDKKEPNASGNASGLPDRFGYIGYFIVLAAVLFDRGALTVRFGWERVGSDDAIFWNVAADIAKGDLHEPFLYGQNYNPALESLLAVPLLWCGMSPFKAFPIITSLLALLPFLAFGYYHMRRREFAQAVIITGVPLLLPVEFGLMTTISRGFVTGIAVLAALPTVLSIRSAVVRDVTLGTLLSFAVAINPNALVPGVPLFVHYALSSRTPVRSALRSMLGAIPPMIALFLAMRFYAMDPDRIIHRLDDWRLVFYWKGLPIGLQQLDRHFSWTTPVWWPTGHVIIWMVLGVLITALIRRNRALACALGSMLVLILFSFGFTKVHDGFEHPIFPFSRMFLALPLVLSWALARSSFSPRMGRLVLAGMLVAAPLYTAIKWHGSPAIITRWMQDQEALPVKEIDSRSIQRDLASLRAIIADRPVDLMIFLREPALHHSMLLAYGAAAVDPGLPPTLFMGKDRRIWRRREETTAVRTNVLIIGGDPVQWQRSTEGPLSMEEVPCPAGPAHLITGNTLPAYVLVQELGFRTE